MWQLKKLEMTYLNDFKRVSTDWFSGAFVAKTLDYLFSMIVVDNALLSTLIALSQMTFAYILTRDFMNMLEPREGQTTRFLDVSVAPVIWDMSPNARNTLKVNYDTFHRYLFGTNKIEETN